MSTQMASREVDYVVEVVWEVTMDIFDTSLDTFFLLYKP